MTEPDTAATEESPEPAPGAPNLGALAPGSPDQERRDGEGGPPSPGADLLNGERRFRSIVASVPMGLHLYRLEPDGRLVFVGANPAADRILGVDNAPFIGKTIEEAFPGLAETEVPRRYRAVAADGANWHTESLMYEEDRIKGAFDVWAFQTLPGHMGALFVDITDRKRTEEDLRVHREHLEELVEERTRELRRAQAELVSAERLATLGRLTATVGHELRNPLAALRAALFTIAGAMRRGDLTPVGRVLELAERSISRCDRIVDELLDYARQPELQLEATEVDHWLGEVLDELGPPAGIEQTRRFESGVRVACDRERLRRAVTNVVLNAHQALAEPSLATRRVSVTTALAGGRLEIRVADTGPGIPAATLARVFEPLFSTKSFGVGLGLSIVRQIMLQHGGDVTVESDAENGATVTLWFPAAAPVEVVP